MGRSAASSRPRVLILAPLLLCAFVVNVDITLVNVTLPTLVRELDASTRTLQWIVDAYTLVLASLVLAAGTLSDRFGRKGMLLAGLVVYAAANLAAGLVDSAGALIALRAVAGLGAAMVFPSTLSIITNVYTERGPRAKAIGAWGATAGAAVALGPIIGGACLEHWSWQSSFLVKVPIAAVAIIAVAALVPTSRDPEARRVDRVGVVLTVLALSAIVVAVIEAPTQGWLSAEILGLGALGLLFGVAWVLWERRTPTPMFDLALLRNPRFAAASAAITFAFFAISGFTFLITQYFQFLDGYDPLEAGIRILPVAAAIVVSSLSGTYLAARIGVGRVVPVGLALLAGAYVWVSAADETTRYLTIVGQMVFLGAGMGFTTAPATDSLMSAASDAMAGVASAVNDTTRELGATLGVAVVGSVFNSVYRGHLDGGAGDRLPRRALDSASDSVGAAFGTAQQLARDGHGRSAGRLHAIATDGFVAGLQVACYVTAGVCLAGALGVALALRPSSRRTEEAPEPVRQDVPRLPAAPGLAATASVAAVLDARLTTAGPRSVLRFLADAIALSDDEVAGVLDASPAAVRRWRTDGTLTLDADQVERLDDLRAVVTLLLCSTRLHPDEIGRFLRARSLHLDHERPLARLRQGEFDATIGAARTLVRGLREPPPTEPAPGVLGALDGDDERERAPSLPRVAL